MQAEQGVHADVWKAPTMGTGASDLDHGAKEGHMVWLVMSSFTVCGCQGPG